MKYCCVSIIVTVTLKRGVFPLCLLLVVCPMFLSGLVVPETGGNDTVPEVVTTSGYALLHFFSDAAYNLTGFTITYSYVEMPPPCFSESTVLFYCQAIVFPISVLDSLSSGFPLQ